MELGSCAMVFIPKWKEMTRIFTPTSVAGCRLEAGTERSRKFNGAYYPVRATFLPKTIDLCQQKVWSALEPRFEPIHRSLRAIIFGIPGCLNVSCIYPRLDLFIGTPHELGRWPLLSIKRPPGLRSLAFAEFSYCSC